MEPDLSSRRSVLKAGGAAVLGSVVAGCATATGINPIALCVSVVVA